MAYLIHTNPYYHLPYFWPLYQTVCIVFRRKLSASQFENVFILPIKTYYYNKELLNYLTFRGWRRCSWRRCGCSYTSRGWGDRCRWAWNRSCGRRWWRRWRFGWLLWVLTIASHEYLQPLKWKKWHRKLYQLNIFYLNRISINFGPVVDDNGSLFSSEAKSL